MIFLISYELSPKETIYEPISTICQGSWRADNDPL